MLVHIIILYLLLPPQRDAIISRRIYLAFAGSIIRNALPDDSLSQCLDTLKSMLNICYFKYDGILHA